jgi:sRNA-binding protein
VPAKAPTPAAVAAEQPKPALSPETPQPQDVVVLTGAPLGSVTFEHKLHAERAANRCDACHHASRPEKPATAAQQACTACHTKAAVAPMKTKRQAAFHNPTASAGTCIDCHRTQNAAGKAAPVKCADCHKKTTT